MNLIKKYIGQLALFVFFFFNSLGLPSPILWTNFAPLCYFRTYFKRNVLPFYLALILLFAIYLPIHLMVGIELEHYLKSLVIYFFILLSIPAVYQYIKNERHQFPIYFKQLAIFSFFLFLMSIVLLLFDNQFLWKLHNLQLRGEVILRYKGFSYEPSFYALLTLPLSLYFLFKTVNEFSLQNLLYLFCVGIPLLLTISYGFFGVFFLAILLSLLISFIIFRFFPFRLGIVMLVLCLILSLLVANVDFLYNRISLILIGQDDSINGRTTEAFYLAVQMIEAKSEWFGIGHGQIKILGEEYIRLFYCYSKEFWPVVALPNAAAETLAIFGYFGLSLRLGVELWIFFYFRVFNNLFNLTLFLFLFIYQFMGSFYMSGTEIAFWIMTSVVVFPEFNMNKLRSSKKKLA